MAEDVHAVVDRILPIGEQFKIAGVVGGPRRRGAHDLLGHHHEALVGHALSPFITPTETGTHSFNRSVRTWQRQCRQRGHQCQQQTQRPTSSRQSCGSGVQRSLRVGVSVMPAPPFRPQPQGRLPG